MNEQQRLIWEVLTSGKMSGEDVANAFTDYHGMQLLDEGFAEHLVGEGFCTESEVGLEQDDEGNSDEEPDAEE